MSQVISSGQTSAVASGEFANGWVVLSSGTMFVPSGGAAAATQVSGGGFLGVVGGVASGTAVGPGDPAALERGHLT
jgi:autotransporter passenger strand-loop-strand repeat protein